MNLKDKIIKSRNIKDASASTYMCSLKKIRNEIYNKKDKKEVDDIEFLNSYEKVMDVINNEKKITTKKNRLTAVLVALQTQKKLNNKLLDKYQEELKRLSDDYLGFLEKQEKTDTQKNNWINYNELIKIINEVATNVKARKISKKNILTDKEFDVLKQYLTLRTYLEFPLRNDFANMKILKSSVYKKIDDDVKKENNYLVLLHNNKKQFHINQFKNKKKIGEKVFNVPKNLNRIINLWLKHNKSGYYLVKKDRKTPLNPNDITKLLNRIFKKYANNKKISTSMLRHIIISHTLKGDKTIKEKKEDEEKIKNKFMHSGQLNQLYRKIDE